VLAASKENSKIFRDDPFQSSLAILPYTHPKQKKPEDYSGRISGKNRPEDLSMNAIKIILKTVLLISLTIYIAEKT